MEILEVVAMPLVVTIVGLVINSSLNDRQSKESNIRLYAEMMARREGADSNLRKDMFTHILSVVTEENPPPKSVGHLEYFEQQVVGLELMAYNFNESIDLGPLFQHLRRKISDSPKDTLAEQQRYDDLRQRLERLAVEVDERQLTVVGDTGVVVRTMADNLAQITQSPANIMFIGPSAIPTAGAKPDDDVNQVCLGLYAPDDKETHYRRFRLEVVGLEPASREIRVLLPFRRFQHESEPGAGHSFLGGPFRLSDDR